jgi:hypothetical protein
MSKVKDNVQSFTFCFNTWRYGVLRTPSSSSCGGLLNAAFSCNLGTFGPNLFVVAPTNHFAGFFVVAILGVFLFWLLESVNKLIRGLF